MVLEIQLEYSLMHQVAHQVVLEMDYLMIGVLEVISCSHQVVVNSCSHQVVLEIDCYQVW